MTNEQIRQNAERHIRELGVQGESRYFEMNGYVAGAHSRDEEVEMLQNQIEELSKQLKIKDINDYGVDLFITFEHGLFRITIPNKTPTVAFLSTLIVDNKHRHQGIGNKLLYTAKLIAKEYDCEVLTLQCNDGWEINWYKRKGFIIIGEGYNPNMILMSCNLSAIDEIKEE